MSLPAVFRFTPLFRRYLWGGRRLGDVLGKPIGPEDDYAESWEVCDHGQDQTVVADGPLAAATLAELVASQGEALFGQHHPQRQFPLLYKFLDARRTLSVQVHPTDAQAACLDPPDRGKTECWVILAAEPGSLIYAGLKPGVDRQTLAHEIARGACEDCLHQFEAQPGDCVFLPAGTVHAIGAGLLVAEIQQSSDTTFRLFDFNRLGPDGKPRPLHVEQALGVIDFGRGPVDPQTPQATDRPHVERLVACDKFVLDRWGFNTPQSLQTDRRCHIVSVVDGRLIITADGDTWPLARGQTVLVPASTNSVELRPAEGVVVLDAYLP